MIALCCREHSGQIVHQLEAASPVLAAEMKMRFVGTGLVRWTSSCPVWDLLFGLGNIWRFPYLCYRSGGGAFLIPYVIFLVLCGMPLFFLETTYGQFASLSPITVWRMSPLFKGVGYGMVIISGIVCVYYNIIITWTIYYLYMCFRAVLPWSTCDNDWNTETCYLRNKSNETSMYSNITNGNSSVWNETLTLVGQVIVNGTNSTQEKKTTASEEFWQRHVLQITKGIEDIGIIRWELLICLAIAWILVFLCLCKGVKSSGRVVYVTATFPYLVLVILLVRGVTLPGAAEGIKFYLIPQWDKLATFKVWGDAAVQIFYSVGMAWGGLITMASYNKFHNNVYRDAMIVPLINCGTSVFAGLVIFSVLGFMAHETGTKIEDVVTQGVDRFYKDIELMIGYKPSIWWKICWKFITPAMIIFIWLFSVTQLSPVTYGKYEYPSWAIAFGWILGIVSLVPLPVCAIIAIVKEEGPLIERVKKLLKPAKEWGPAVNRHREEYLASLDSASAASSAMCITYVKQSPIVKQTVHQTIPEMDNLVKTNQAAENC
ncbi:hypothetical protein KUTeg_024237 [Tegillarca granosa]|uniref:Transporter n=1 Tax=Tegillarca granosa TaxID=220873 RepID=A0ABQ9DZT8_TEGGR|nr:hypothetical protein KUTeg_024237 [Tegillarca granosa]